MQDNHFNYSSFRERVYLKKNLLPEAEKVTYTPISGYDRHDYTFERDGRLFIVEVKVRLMASTDYQTTLLEKRKYDYLIDLADSKGGTALLHIFFTKDRKMAFVNLSKLRGMQGYSGECPATSSKESEYRLKEIVHLPLEGAMVKNFFMPPCDKVVEGYSRYVAALKNKFMA